MSDDQIKIIKWFSGIDLEDAQLIAKPLSAFLKLFERVKKNSPNVCRLSPCQKHQYARGVCARHYNQLRRISSIVGWSQLVLLGLCTANTLHDLAISDAKIRSKATLQIPRSNLSASERKLLGMKP